METTKIEGVVIRVVFKLAKDDDENPILALEKQDGSYVEIELDYGCLRRISDFLNREASVRTFRELEDLSYLNRSAYREIVQMIDDRVKSANLPKPEAATEGEGK